MLLASPAGLSLAIGLSLIRPDARPDPEPDGAPPCPQVRRGLGPAAAAVTLRYYVDPIAGASVRNWLRLEQLVTERAPELRLELVVVRPVGQRTLTQQTLAENRVRRFVVAALEHVRPADVLRLIARNGWERVHAQLLQSTGRAAVALELGLSQPQLETALAPTSCLETAIRRAGQAVAAAQTQALGSHVQLPVLSLTSAGGFSAWFGAELRDQDLRDRLDHALRVGRGALRTAPSRLDDSGPLPPRMPVAGRGLRVGRAGSPHHAVILAESEGDPVLTQQLPVVLAQMRARPGRLSLRVAAVGSSAEARAFAPRLCAASQLGLELELLRFASLATNQRGPTPAWRHRLNEVATQPPCRAASPITIRPDTQDSLSPGLWLDGEPVRRTTRQQLQRLRANRPPPPLWIIPTREEMPE
ncbi:MAG: hypothetical protein B7733_22280 [Myxococcales bacterium FL481]|nr:MAG: hypothetical protein B7733_22280 [Myxococcales bacterium FL481]